MEKGEIARNEQFLLFPLCFLPVWRTFWHFHLISNCRLQTLSVLKSLKFVVWERVNIDIIVISVLTHGITIQKEDSMSIVICLDTQVEWVAAIDVWGKLKQDQNSKN